MDTRGNAGGKEAATKKYSIGQVRAIPSRGRIASGIV
jgi:hypothetical protein